MPAGEPWQTSLTMNDARRCSAFRPALMRRFAPHQAPVSTPPRLRFVSALHASAAPHSGKARAEGFGAAATLRASRSESPRSES
jgi:hypothetical protein